VAITPPVHQLRKSNPDLLPRCYQDRTNQAHPTLCPGYPALWFLVGLGLSLDLGKFLNRGSLVLTFHYFEPQSRIKITCIASVRPKSLDCVQTYLKYFYLGVSLVSRS
jgi:hypothetical protein